MRLRSRSRSTCSAGSPIHDGGLAKVSTSLLPLWTPSEARSSRSRLGRFLSNAGFATYESAWNWSTTRESLGDFWTTIATEFNVRWYTLPSTAIALDPNHPTGVRWFPDGYVNYAEQCLRVPPERSHSRAVVAHSQTR